MFEFANLRNLIGLGRGTILPPTAMLSLSTFLEKNDLSTRRNDMKNAFSGFMVFILAMYLTAIPSRGSSETPEIKFDHNHTFAETVAYLEAVQKSFPNITKLHTIGKSFEGRDLLVLEISNQKTGKGLYKD